MTFLLLLLVYEFVALLYSFALSKNDIMAPSVIMCIMFLISTSFALVNVNNWNIQYDPKAFLLISSGLTVFIIGEVIVRLFATSSNAINNQIVLNNHEGDAFYYKIKCNNFILLFLLGFNIVVSFWFFLKIRRVVGLNRISFSAIISIYRSLSTQNKGNAGEELISGIVVQLIKIVKASGYVAGFIFLGNLHFNNKRMIFGTKSPKMEPFLLCLIMLTSLLPSIMTAGRADILKFLSALIIEYYILWHQKNGWNRNLSSKYLKIGVLSVVGGIFVFYYSLSYLGRSTSKGIFAYTSIYLGSSIQLFNLYVQNPAERTSWGEESLVGIHKILSKIGIVEPSKFSNLEFRQLSPNDGASNIYTFFRRPLHDFGVIGMYMFTLIIALMFSYIYYIKIKNKKKTFATDCWILIYGYLYYWIVSSSMLQYSGAYISFGTITILTCVLLLFYVITRTRIRIKK